MYAPNTDSPEFFRQVTHDIIDMGNDFKIIGGNFNLVLDIEKDKSGGLLRKNEGANYVKSYMEVDDVLDIWREVNEDKLEYTWKKLNPTPILVRLDYILVSEALLQLIDLTEIIPNTHSDHSAVGVHLCANQSEKGSGFWKLNNSLLDDQVYVDKIKNVIQEEMNKQYESNALRWEMVKMEVRGTTIQYATRKKKANENKLQVLEKKLQEINDRITSETTKGRIKIYHYSTWN